MEQRKREEQAKLKWLCGAVCEGLDQIERGEGTELESMGALEAELERIGVEARAVCGRKA